jgi:hypothetical protein
MSIRWQFFIPPLNVSVKTCPHYPNDEDLNICGESEADKLPIGEHQVRSQGLSALLLTILRRNSTLRNNNSQPLCYWSYWSVLMTMAAVSGHGHVACLARCGMLRTSPDASGRRCRVSVCNVSPGRLPWSSMLHMDRWHTKHILSYHLHRNPIVDFCDGMKKSDSDDRIWQRMFNIQCEDLMMLRFSNTKSSMLFQIRSVGKVPRVELDK